MGIPAELILETLLGLLTHFPNSGHSAQSMILIAPDYQEDFEAEGMTPINFIAAAKEARRRTSFFPTSADIIKAHAVVASRPAASKVMAITGRGEQAADPEYAQDCTAMIREWLTGDYTEDEKKAMVAANQAKHGKGVVEWT